VEYPISARHDLRVLSANDPQHIIAVAVSLTEPPSKTICFVGVIAAVELDKVVVAPHHNEGGVKATGVCPVNHPIDLLPVNFVWIIGIQEPALTVQKWRTSELLEEVIAKIDQHAVEFFRGGVGKIKIDIGVAQFGQKPCGVAQPKERHAICCFEVVRI